MTPSSSSDAFSSFRIIGKKAQKLFDRARKGVAQSQKESKSHPSRFPSTPKHLEVTAHISVASVARALFTLLAILFGVWMVFQLRDKLILLLIAAFIAVVIDPSVQGLRRLHVPRGVAVLLHYLVAILALIFLVVSFIPIIAIQLQQISLFLSTEVNVFLSDPQIHLPLVSSDVNIRLTALLKTSLEQLAIHDFTGALERAGSNLSDFAGGSWEVVKTVTGSVAAFVTDFIIVLVLAFFMQMEKEKILQWTRGFLPDRYRSYTNLKLEAIHTKISQWARGELLLMFSIFALTLVALIILRMPYALTLAVLAGFCEFVPAVGPFIAAIPAVIIGVTQGGFMWGVVLIAVYYVIQWCENNLLVPLIMKRAVGLSPIAILFALLAGISFPETIHPVLGVLLAIPTTTVLAIFLEDVRSAQERKR
ncbi:MAG: AI-2E family transporter [Candidatus Peribacteraceae bacterium]|nr:AI-2E family transporter [Candidatus Peribacteraceae bacterium]MDD5742592.1 AI-2E family transporter [Candidatus Peribacteraceae bacterium]